MQNGDVMPFEPAIPPALADLGVTRLAALPSDCGNETMPGTDESPRNRDWSERPTTRDQKRIEDFIAPLLQKGSRLLHVGIGNSLLARRFSGQVAAIAGATIARAELDHAQTLCLQDYTVHLANKYARSFVKIGHGFDFIIDNNPTTFACCRIHFFRMMASYQAMLAPGGMIVTDRAGLAHLASDNPALERWRFSPDDWLALARTLDMTAVAQGADVLTMQKLGLAKIGG